MAQDGLDGIGRALDRPTGDVHFLGSETLQDIVRRVQAGCGATDSQADTQEVGTTQRTLEVPETSVPPVSPAG